MVCKTRMRCVVGDLSRVKPNNTRTSPGIAPWLRYVGQESKTRPRCTNRMDTSFELPDDMGEIEVKVEYISFLGQVHLGLPNRVLTCEGERKT